MTLHYLKIALRNLLNFKLQTVVCLTGLAVGMACFGLGSLWLRHIASFEDFVPNADNIYMVLDANEEKAQYYDYNTTADVYKDFLEQMPGVSRACQLRYNSLQSTFSSDQVVHQKLRVAYTDSAYVRMFSIKAVEGSLARFDDGEVAITRSAAERLWKEGGAVGQTLIENDGAGERTYKVAAVIDDRPLNTQFDFEVLAHSEAMLHNSEVEGGMLIVSIKTFLEFEPSVPRDSIEGVRRLKAPSFSAKDCTDYTLAPLRSLRTDYVDHNVLILTSYIRFFVALGVLVILCSLANYLITLVSHLSRRGWEMSLRRVLGSSRAGIIKMVSIETLLTFLLAALLGLGLTVAVLPQFREYSGINLPLSAVAPRLAVYLLIVVAAGLIATTATAWIVMLRTQRNVLSSRSLALPTRKGRGLHDLGGEFIQMTMAFAILFSAAVMLRQVRLILFSNEYGISVADRVLVKNVSEELRTRIRQLPFVEETLEGAETIFPRTYWISCGVATDESRRGDWQDYIGGAQMSIDSTVMRFYDMRLVAGRLPVYDKYKNLTHQETVDVDFGGQTFQATATFRVVEVALSEEFCRRLGFSPESAVGQSLWDHWKEYRVSGVIADVYQRGPLSPPDAVMYQPVEKWNDQNVAIRTAPGHARELTDSIERWISETDCDESSKPQVVDCEAAYAEFVASERMLIRILLAVGGASLFICVTGTFSLVSLSLQRRRKEIAIRKVHGAKRRHILALFTRSHVATLAAAAAVAFPIAFVAMKHWLEGYPKQTEIAWWLVPLTFVAIAAVVILTITLKILRSAKENPVEALKY